MASFLRGKQAGIQNDLSAGILPDSFAPDDQARFGINSQIGYVGSPGTLGAVLLTALFHQFPRIRSRTIPFGNRNERDHHEYDLGQT